MGMPGLERAGIPKAHLGKGPTSSPKLLGKYHLVKMNSKGRQP